MAVVVNTMNPTIFWLVVLVVLVIVEIATMGLTTIWFAGGALVAMIAAAVGAPVFIQIPLFLIVSFLLLYFTRPIAVRYFNRDRTRTNVESMLGRKGIVTGAIDNLNGQGQVTVGGMPWSARSASDSVKIPAGAVVTIQAVHGVKLIVEETKEEV